MPGSGGGQGVEDGREGFGVIRAADEVVGRRRRLGRTPAQVILRWHVQTGFAVIPGSRNVDHIRDNLAILDFALSDADMAAIAALDTQILALLKAYSNQYRWRFFRTTATIADPDIEQHFVNINLAFNFNNE